MASGSGRRELVRLNESWTHTSFGQSNILVTTHTHVILGYAEPVSTRCVVAAEFLAKLPKIKSHNLVYSPMSVEVDAYIDFLEQHFAAEQERIMQIEEASKIAAGTSHPESTLWWFVVAGVIASICWLLRS